MNELREHRAVMRDEAVAALAPRADGVFVDATYGRGGHAAALLSLLGDNARLWLVDRDPQAVAWARERHGDDCRCRIVQANFADLGAHLRAAGLAGQVTGILLDLGVSSPQLDEAERGFSFLRDGPLDMRMDNGEGETAAQWLERVDTATLVHVLKEYGEERYARRIAAAIVRARDGSALPRTTTGLASLIAAAVPRPEPGRHPATRSFQAIRIHLNDELGSLSALLEDVIDLLAPQGRLVVISFHSLEDRRVKRFMTRNSQVGELPPGAGIVPPEKRPSLRRVGRAHRPDDDEVRINPRARSATMRVAERLP
ncbi:16S rRNA (cytosine(1402)-N(4))-methyltransferase RsmH [Spiribacter vilamensis]|uniref:Ribosomal RNA small subunit methyltransferase H n=1 Tax=Spiribacter vilamensis TaxID=531306 RepID=A0A4V2GIV5_9GAMM|nr:16S rRNA (cytosine(1402)-N(4))-methyltransferase RsmH [Spiribacter vilamensis]RZU97905.1 16S rRNA (cytosine1402-N4)-methyltransferase [Spiribacter vilamensis]TVO61181.1 16S rRNA (cytosine(1402)-N(4))-methyltransferase RsmH [Spiribacter vilamensis]